MSETTHFKYATELPLAYESVCEYKELPEDHFLIASGQVGFMNKPHGIFQRTDCFRVIEQKNLSLVGFRTFTTSDGQFFLDESLDPLWDRSRYTKHFANNGRHEDYQAAFDDAGVSLTRPTQQISVDEPVTTLCTGEIANYGSWIYRVLPKLAELPRNDRPLFLYHPRPWMQEFLQLFAPNRRLMSHDPRLQYLFRDAQVAGLRNVDVYFDEQSRSFYRDAAMRIEGKSSHKKIYLSRIDQKIRPFLNEAQFQDRLVSEGFKIVYPEQLSLTDRIRVMRDAEVVVCPGGSGLFNLVFAQNAKLVVDIEPSTTWLSAHHRLCKSLHLPHVVVFGEQQADLGPHAPWSVDIERVIGAIHRS